MFGLRSRSAIVCVGVLAASAIAAGFPDRPIDFLVTWGAGGGADKFARTIGPEMEKVLKVAIPVSNVPGAAGNTGLGKLIASKPDGYSFATMTGVTFTSFAAGKSPYKVENFDWIVRVEITPSMLFVPADSPFKTFADLKAFAEKNPNKLRVATDGLGTPADLTLKYLASKGIKMRNIPFDNPGERYTAPLGGHVELVYEEPGDIREFLVAKKVRPLIVFDRERFQGHDVPSSYELGYEVAIFNWRGLVAKAGTPPDRLKALGDAARIAMKSPRWQEFCGRDWTCDAKELSGDAFRAWAQDQFAQLKALSAPQ
jgi:tripartite-type tricarboxylate transporter receptor subunit TctC